MVNKRLIWNLETSNIFYRRTMWFLPQSLNNKYPSKTTFRHNKCKMQQTTPLSDCSRYRKSILHGMAQQNSQNNPEGEYKW